jgi:hypothetical protein
MSGRTSPAGRGWLQLGVGVEMRFMHIVAAGACTSCMDYEPAKPTCRVPELLAEQAMLVEDDMRFEVT